MTSAARSVLAVPRRDVAREEAGLDPTARARDGDLDAFDRLVQPHAPGAYRLAVAVVGESLARDLVGDAFVAAWQQLPRLPDPDRFAPGLCRIVVNRGRSLLRRGGSVREIPVSAFHDAAMGERHASLVPAEARAVLAGAFAALSYDQRAIIALHDAAGLTLSEVAQALDIPASAARPRLAAALEALRRRAGLDAGGRRSPQTLAGERMPPQDDPRLEAFLRSLAAAPVPADLVAFAGTRVREHRRRRPSLRLPVLAGAAGLLLVVSAAMAMGWGPPFDLLPGPGPTRAPSTLPGPTEPPGPTATPPAVLPGVEGTFARVTTHGAELRTEPGGGEVIKTLDDDEIGLSVLVLGRAVVDGRGWTRVEWEDRPWSVRFAWLPETVPSSGPTGYELTVLQPTTWMPCPGVGDLAPEQVAGLTQAERLACFGSRSITIGPVMVDEDGRFSGDGSPGWLAGPAAQVITGVIETGQRFVVAPLRLRPDVGLPVPSGEWLRLTGHFDDGAAWGCEPSVARADSPVEEVADQVLWCRQQLVVTGWTVDRAPSTSPGVQGRRPVVPPPARDGHRG